MQLFFFDRLLWLQESPGKFELFCAPFQALLQQLARQPSFRDQGVRGALVGVCRDLRGVARRSSVEHLIATKALRYTATAWILIVAQCSAIP